MEIELKLALLASDALHLQKQLAALPLLARRRSTKVHLHNTYYDTDVFDLRQHRVVLRIRRKGSAARPQWVQTLKIGDSGDSPLSQRDEWEVPVGGAALQRDVLAGTPWKRIDPRGTVFENLAPCFVTDFHRTSWLVRRRDRSVVEVALDIGQVVADGRSAQICELELELLSGKPQALFHVAQEIAASLAVLPLPSSKSDRGYALAQNTLAEPRRAEPPALALDLTIPQAASLLLREMLAQFTVNLNALRFSDGAELVHQARVGWRRFRSAWRLLRADVGNSDAPSWAPLQPLMTFLGELRDLDVARTETLPALAAGYATTDPHRAEEWKALELAFENAALLRRKTVRYALEDPAVGICLLATTQWLEEMSAASAATMATGKGRRRLRPWARHAVDRLNRKLRRACKSAADSGDQHQVRIVAKRLRYSIEALGRLLPGKQSERRRQHAISLQARIGATRDYLHASAIAEILEADRGLVQFLRGFAAGRENKVLHVVRK